jgi:hypothetical protein
MVVADPDEAPPMAEVVQEGAGFYVSCRVHGRIEPEPGKVWVSHISAGMACATHLLFVFHGRGAR